MDKVTVRFIIIGLFGLWVALGSQAHDIVHRTRNELTSLFLLFLIGLFSYKLRNMNGGGQRGGGNNSVLSKLEVFAMNAGKEMDADKMMVEVMNLYNKNSMTTDQIKGILNNYSSLEEKLKSLKININNQEETQLEEEIAELKKEVKPSNGGKKTKTYKKRANLKKRKSAKRTRTTKRR